jgi:hypothetical protein
MLLDLVLPELALGVTVCTMVQFIMQAEARKDEGSGSFCLL